MIHLGKRATIYPTNCAMHGAVEIKCFGGWLVFFPPIKSFGEWQKLRCYWSPNATPWHHDMVPIICTKYPMDCSCGAMDCPIPRQAVKYYA